MYNKFFSFLACIVLICACQNDDFISEPTVLDPSKGAHRVIMVVDGDTLTGDESQTRASKVINNATVYGVGTYSHGANVSVSAYPNTGYFITSFKVTVGDATCSFSSISAKGTIEAITEDVTFHVETRTCPVVNIRAYNGYLTSGDPGDYFCPHRILAAQKPGDMDSYTTEWMSGLMPWRYTEARIKDGKTYYPNTAGPTLKTTFPGIEGTLLLSTNNGSRSEGTAGRLPAQPYDMLVVHNFQQIGDYRMDSYPNGVNVPYLMGSENSSTVSDKWYETDYELTYFSPKAGKQCRFVRAVISDFDVYESATHLTYDSSTKTYYVKDILPSSYAWTTDYSEHFLYEDIKAGNAIDLKRMKLKLIDLRKRSQISSIYYCGTTIQPDLDIDFSNLNWSSAYGCWYVAKPITGSSDYVIVYVMQGNARKTMRDIFSSKSSSSSQTWSKATGNQLYIALKYTHSASDINPQSNVTWFF